MRAAGTSLLGYSLLAGIAATSILLPDTLTVPSVRAQAEPDGVRLLGVVRDFRMAHPDFNVLPSGGLGDSSGTVQLKLGPKGKPRTESIISSHGSNGASTVVDTISKWGFNEANGTTADDNRNVQDGTLMNGATRTTKGRFGKAVVFDGVDDHVAVPHDPAYLVDAASVAFWFRANETVTPQALVSKDGLSYITGGHLTCLIVNEQLRVRLQSTSNSYYVESPLGSIQPDTWYHVAFSFGPTSGMMLYIDNVLIDSNPYAGGLGTSSGGIGNEQPWAFGMNTWTSSTQGVLDRFDTVSYSGNDGARSWSGDWVESDPQGGGAATGKARVTGGDLALYGHTGAGKASVTREVDLSSTTSPVFSFDYRTTPDAEPDDDRIQVEISSDGGSSWTVLESFDLDDGAGQSGYRSYDVTAYRAGNTQIRFRMAGESDDPGLAFTVDNVQVGEPTNLTDPFAGMLDNVQIFTRELENEDFKVVGGYIVDHTGRDASNRPIPPHLDEDDAAPCFSAGDTPAVIGPTSDSGVSSSDTFSEWFSDVPGTNLSAPHAITLNRDAGGVYEYLTDDFYPADGRLFGNEGTSHNEFYTYSFAATFTYTQCAGQFLEFQGGDGAWMFIDEDLTLDLGGVGSTTEQHIEFDRLGLVDGQDYTLRFFYAQRWAGSATFRLRTNVWLRQGTNPSVVVSGTFD